MNKEGEDMMEDGEGRGGVRGQNRRDLEQQRDSELAGSIKKKNLARLI